jgi:hypothetical protein
MFQFCFAVQCCAGLRGTGVYCYTGLSALKCVLEMERIDSLYLFCCPVTKREPTSEGGFCIASTQTLSIMVKTSIHCVLALAIITALPMAE